MKLMIGTRWMRGAAATMVALMAALPVAAQVTGCLASRRYTTQDGLPQMQAERVWQDSRGYIYIGTLSGLVRFDGRSFTPFLKGKRYNIVGFAEVDGQVWALDFRHRWLVGQDEVEMEMLDPEGRWLLNNFNSGDLPNGMLLMEDEQEKHRWVARSEELGVKSEELGVRSEKLGVRGEDGMWLQRLVSLPLLDSMMPDRKLYMDDGWLYIPTEQGLYRTNGISDIDASQHHLPRVVPQCLSEKSDFYALCRWGKVLYAFAEDGIYRVENDSVRLHTPFDGWQTGYGLIVREAEGELLIADEHSLYAFDGHAVSKLHGGVNLIKDLLIDRWGRLWMATYQGVYCFFGRHFVNHRLADENDIARAVAANPGARGKGRGARGMELGVRSEELGVRGKGRGARGMEHIVTGTLNGKIMVDGKMVLDDPDNFFIPSAARLGDCVYLAGRGDVACVRDSSVRWLGLPFERYQYITEANGRLILLTRQLIAAWDPTTGAVDTLSTEVPHPWCAAADGEGRLWVGSTFGLFCVEQGARGEEQGAKGKEQGVKGKEQGAKSEEQGARSRKPTTSKGGYNGQKLIITTMEADDRGAVFFASGDSLFLIRHGEVTELSSQLPELEGHEVRSLYVSPRGCLVVAAIDGLFVCRISEDYRLSDCCFFDHTNGFTMIEPLKTRMTETEDGTVWLCGVEEMVSFQPEALIAAGQTDTFIRPPLRWWQHWWVWVAMTAMLAAAVWALARWYEKLRHRRKMMRLLQEKHRKEQLIRAIRQEAIKAEQSELAKDIVKMTDKEATKQLMLRTNNGTIRVEVTDIVYMKADGNYTQMAMFDGTELVLTGLGTLAQMLKEPQFMRADRSTLVNLNYICRLNANLRTCTFKSPDGKELETTLHAPAFKRLEKELVNI